MSLKVWLDCDPGHDDMLAIIMAALSPECHLIGISTSAGNSTIQNTTQNTLNILCQINRKDIVVVRGAEKPLVSVLQTAPDVHGPSGLQGAHLKVCDVQPITKNNFYYIYTQIMEQPQPIDFVVTGANTNLAILLKAFPDIKQKIKRITIMGGAIGLGNWSPAAQFNILVDPQAAAIVFNCGIRVNVIPLEVSHTVLITEEIFEEFANMKSQFSQKLIQLMRYFQLRYKENQNFDFPVAHDPCTIYYLLHPEHFIGQNAYVQIQLEGKSRGRLNCNFLKFKHGINAFVCTQINVKQFWNKMLDCLRKIE